MDFEERERQQRRQFIKVVIAEIGMVLAVVAIVVVTTLAAMGFFVSKDGTIEQSGLIQVHSMPTGATVEVDNATLFARTNLSRTLAAGQYDLKITREGYDTWSKQVQIYSGTLIRLYYPRLFLENRKAEKVRSLSQDLMFYAPSADRTNILYAYRGSTDWYLMDIRGDDVREKKIDLAKVLKKADQEKFTGQVEILEWSKDNGYVLIRSQVEQKVEWILVNLSNVDQSLNLTTTFGMDFDQVEMMGGSARQLFAREHQHLRRINTVEQAVSKVLLDNIVVFDSSETSLMYVMLEKRDGKTEQLVGTYRDGETGGTTIARLPSDAKVRVSLSRYYDEDYLAYTTNQEMTIYYGAVPTYREETDFTELSGLKVLMEGQELTAVPDQLSVSSEGEFLVGWQGDKFMAVDLEMNDLHEYVAPTKSVKWLDESILYTVRNGGLEVWDFDFTNQRHLVQLEPEDATIEERKPVTTYSKIPVVDRAVVISENNKWLYYLANEGERLELMREKIRD